MRKSQIAGFGILALTALSTAGVQHLGAQDAVRTYTVDFSRGVDMADGGAETARAVAAALAGNPDYVAVVEGHTSTLGDAQANIDLSERRAQAVAEEIVDVGASRDRIETIGVGGGDPLPRKDGEGDRAYRKRLSRAEITVRVD